MNDQIVGKSCYIQQVNNLTMVTVIKKGTPIEKMKQLLNEAFSRTPKKNIRKYAGVLKTDIDPLEYQKQMRDEWE